MPVASLVLKARQIGGITHSRLCFDQPNRRIRTRMFGGVGGTPCEGRSYPDVCRAWPGCYMVMSDIMTQVLGKVQTQPDGGEG